MTDSDSTKVFLDTEFLDDGRLIEMISIGLVAETGAEYYAVSADCDIKRVLGNSWLRTNVVPHLPLDLTRDRWAWDPQHPDYCAVKPRSRIACEILDFFAELSDPETWAYFSPFDTVVLSQLYGPMSELPTSIPGLTRDLMQEAQRHRVDLPKQTAPVHHALNDARHDLAIARAIGLVRPPEPPATSPKVMH